MLREYFAVSLAALLMLAFASECAALQPVLHCEAAVLMDALSGRILYQQRADFKRPIASITKIMTAIVTIESGRMHEVVTVSPKAAGIGGSTLGLRTGERISVRDLLYALMLRSANDAAVALAEHLAGDMKSFANLMTEKAKEIGAINTRFSNSHGLDHPQHYSTARDIALITRYALSSELFSAIVNARALTISRSGGSYQQRISNINRFLRTYPKAIGVKTGYTSGAGQCLVGAAEDSGRILIAVVLNSSRRYQDCAALMDYGFEEYHWELLLDKHRKVTEVAVRKGRQDATGLYPLRTVIFPLKESERELLSVRINAPAYVEAPFESGEIVGTADLLIEETCITSVPLTVRESVKRKTVWDFFGQSWNGWLIR